jgi:hypothetical protein
MEMLTLSSTKEDAPYEDHENVVQKVDGLRLGMGSFLYCIKFSNAHRRVALEFICCADEIKYLTSIHFP